MNAHRAHRRSRRQSFRKPRQARPREPLSTYPRRLALETLENQLLLSTTFTVGNTGDSGPGSLRQAMLDANATANVSGPDTITFNISETDPGFDPSNGPAGAFTIRPLSVLPTITDPVVIDGYTQPGAQPNTNPVGSGLNTVLKIELDGTLCSGLHGLTITAGNSTVRGLAINRFADCGIVVHTNGGNAIEGNVIGTDVTGTVALGNGFNDTWNAPGVLIVSGAQSNRIGTDGNGVADSAEWNIISGSAGYGVGIVGASTNHNVVAGNFIGTDASGTVAVANGGDGVLINAGAQSNLIGTDGNGVADAAERNLISGNARYGLRLSSPGTELNVIAGNFIGTDVTGMVPLGNDNDGVHIDGGAQSNRVGTDGNGVADTAERNVISANQGDGVRIHALGAGQNVVAGNYIGTDVTGTVALGNGGRGVTIEGGARQNRIGTTGDGTGDEAERNLICANGAPGILIEDSETDHNVVAGNFIGTDVTGTTALGNGEHGVFVSDGAHSNQIGGATTLGNTIAFNPGAGVAVVDDSSIGNRIQANAIHSNGGLGIDLGGDGVTANDPGDADTGPNNLQNFPVISLARPGATTRVVGSLNSTPDTTFTLDFYASSEADPSGYGEGERWLDSAVVTTEAEGNASFDLLLAAATVSGKVITATATDPHGNTSEFSGADVLTRVPIQIDVKPGSDRNPINLASKGVIAVAILTTADFDASWVDAGTVVFAGARAVHHALEDVDGDGDLDVVLHFRTQDTILADIYAQLLADDIKEDGVLDSNRQGTAVSLTGETISDEFFEGFDDLDLFLSGKNLREFLEDLAKAGAI